MENPQNKWRFLAGKIIYFYGPFSMAMWNNQWVYGIYLYHIRFRNIIFLITAVPFKAKFLLTVLGSNLTIPFNPTLPKATKKLQDMQSWIVHQMGKSRRKIFH